MAHGVERIVREVAEYDGTRPEELPPLGDSIDADCLDGFFSEGTAGMVRFDYHGYTVTYHADGSVEVDATERHAFD